MVDSFTETRGTSIDDGFRCKSVEENRGPAVIAYLTVDVLIDILSRLPVKSLLRFKCVSKGWHSLISNSSCQGILPATMSGLFYSLRLRGISSGEILKYTFIASRFQPNNNNVVIDEASDLSFFPHHHRLCIVSCCNGLLLGLTCGISSTPVYYVINPVTKKWAVLPKPPKRCSHRTHMLAFDPHVSPHYAIICSNFGCGLFIFSSKTGVWVQPKVPEKLVPLAPGRPPSVLLNRTLHMLSAFDAILGFDLDGECFRLIALSGPMPRNLQKCIGASGGYLYYANHDGSQLQIWMLKDYDEHKWVLKHQTTINSLVEKHPQVICSSSFYEVFYKHHLLYQPIAMLEGSYWPFWLHMKYLNYNPILVNQLSREYYQYAFSLLAFHPDFEVVFLRMGDTLLSYHFNSMKLEEVSGLNPTHGTPRDMIDWENVYPFLPCLADFYDDK